jgi:ribonuclease HII
MLKPFYNSTVIEAGLDEAGRGPLAGPVVAAAVILPPDYHHPFLNDSKQLTASQRFTLVEEIKKESLAWAIAECSAQEIDTINILNASILAMHRAVDSLSLKPEHLIVDGNKFKPYLSTPHTTIVKGDSKFLSIAAASVLAKTHRDEFMTALATEYPKYGWEQNFGYPTLAHRKAIFSHGFTPWHRKTFKVKIGEAIATVQ